MAHADEEFKAVTVPQQIFMTLEDPTFVLPIFPKLPKLISNFIMSLIVLGCITYVMESMPMFNTMEDECKDSVLADDIDIKEEQQIIEGKAGLCVPEPLPFFMLIESVCIYIFTVEYVLRLFTVHTVPEKVWNIKEEALEEPDDDDEVHVKHEKGRFGLTKGYATTFMNLIDLVAILPFYLEAAIGDTGLGVIRVLRLTRVLRVLKSPKFAEAVKLFSLSLSLSIPALSILFFFNILGIILMGSLVFFFESGKYSIRDDVCCPSDVYAQSLLTEDVFHTCQLGCFIRPNYLGMGHEVSPYTSIPTSFYWVIVTMTTVGYGDLLPTTSFGRFLSIFVMYSGIFGLALPITVIGANFSRQYELLNIAKKQRKELEELKKAGASGAGVPMTPNAKAAPRSGPISSGGRYEVSDVTEEDEAAALQGELRRNDMKAILAAMPRVERAVAENVQTAQSLQTLLQRLRKTVDEIQKC
jgi:hypothetical protein